MISVIIAAKDAEKWIGQTIESLLSQSFKDWECILSVNGSSDATQQIAESLSQKDNRFKTVVSDIPNKSLALNRAIIQSSRDLISILDADDLWYEKKLEHQIQYIISNEVDIVGTQMSYINDTGSIIPNAPLLPSGHNECVAWLQSQRNPIANSSVVYKKSLHDKVGYYDPEKFAVEDYDMWMRSARLKLKLTNLSEKYLFHRLHNSSNFNSNTKQQKHKELVDALHKFYYILDNQNG